MELLELANGTFLYGRRHMACHAEVIPILPEVCEKLGQIQDPLLVKTISMGRVVGKSGVVKVAPGERTFYARRPKRHGLSHFVEGRKAEDSEHVTIVIRKERAFNRPAFRIVTAYVGKLAPREPEDTTLTDEERKESISFWREHAFTEDFLTLGPTLERRRISSPI